MPQDILFITITFRRTHGTSELNMNSSKQPRSSTEPETVTETFDWDQREDVQTAVINTVAAVTDQDPTEMKPLSNIIDPDSLGTLFAPTRSTPRSTGCITFQYQGCTVGVDAEGTVKVTQYAK